MLRNVNIFQLSTMDMIELLRNVNIFSKEDVNSPLSIKINDFPQQS